MFVNMTHQQYDDISRALRDPWVTRDQISSMLSQCVLDNGGRYDPDVARTGLVEIELRVVEPA